jgi:CarD family transcriptional regulator
MMKFNIGDTIIEPTNGICIMEGMRRMSVDSKDMVVYIFQASSAKVYVPADQIEKRNIRLPMDREEVKKVLASLKQPVSPNREDARLQYNAYRDIMKSGDPMKIARLLRDLFILDQANDLKGKEKEILEQAKKFLCDEISFVRQQSKAQILEQINESLRQMYKKKQARDKEKVKKSGVDVNMAALGYGEDEEEKEEADETESLEALREEEEEEDEDEDSEDDE